MLAAPSSGTGDAMLGQAIEAAMGRGLVAPGDYVVCVSAENHAIQLKIVAVDDYGKIHSTQGATHDGEEPALLCVHRGQPAWRAHAPVLSAQLTCECTHARYWRC